MIRIGVVGAGGMGNVHTRHYKTMDDVEVRIFDRSSAQATKFCETHSCESAPDFDALLEWADAIDICLPTDMHADCAIRALEKGKHVLCEKPLASTVEECERMIDAAEKSGVVLMPAQVVRYFPAYQLVHQHLQQNAVGEVIGARLRRGGKAPVGSEGWFQDAERSGGVLLDLVVHDFDWLGWNFGDVVAVTSRSALFGGTKLDGIPGDYAHTLLEFASGMYAEVTGTWLDPSGFRTSIEVVGKDGMIEFDSRYRPTPALHKADGSTDLTPENPPADPYYQQGRAFIEAIQGKTPAVTGLDGLKAVRIARAAIESAKTGQPVRL